MNVSDRYRYIYFVAPKCGSATARYALKPYTDIGYPVTQVEQHVTIRKYLAKYETEGRFERYFKFTFVRNPYDRIYSGFKQDLLASTRWEPWISRKAPIFARIGENFERYLIEHAAKADIRNAWDWICFCPMTEFAYLDGMRVVDWVGRMETIKQDLTTLGERLGVPIGDIGHYNKKSAAADGPADAYRYLDRYTPDALACVNELYAEDFAAFDYPMLSPDDLRRGA